MIKFNYRVIIFILFYLSILTSCSAQKLVYEPIGDMDKPLPNIEIVAKGNDDFRNKVFVLNKHEFDLLIKHVQSQFEQRQNSTKTEYEYGAYRVFYYNGSEKIEFIYETKEKSSVFFQGQLEITKSNSKLYEELLILIKRLK